MHSFHQYGFALILDVISNSTLYALQTMVDALPNQGAGNRDLLDVDLIQTTAKQLKEHPSVAYLISTSHVVIQCTLFDKTPDCNWLEPFHQDLSIPAVPTSTTDDINWHTKNGKQYFQPDATFLNQMVVLRLHLDPVNEDNGALKVIPNSHLLGRLPTAHCAPIANKSVAHTFQAEAGDAWLMRPLLIHASSKAKKPERRRVLHFVLAPKKPPKGVMWKQAI